MMDENHKLPTDTDFQAAEGNLVLESQQAKILCVSKRIPTVNVLPRDYLKYECLAGYLFTALLRGNSWALLDGVITDGGPG